MGLCGAPGHAGQQSCRLRSDMQLQGVLHPLHPSQQHARASALNLWSQRGEEGG